MGNPYFHFKKFSVQQDNVAMKVCTDACLFGAWVASQKCNPRNILDIGTGTGLLSLMLAQKTSADITAIDIENEAYWQSKENFDHSPWKERLSVLNISIQQFVTDERFDLIVCNPPFFKNDLRPQSGTNVIARHEETLSLPELIQAAKLNASEQGSLAVLVPYHRLDDLRKICREQNMSLIKIAYVRQTPSHGYFRAMVLVSTSCGDTQEEEIFIRAVDGSYSNEFQVLLCDYYQKL